MEAEKIEVGAIPLKTYTTYIKYAGGYFFSFFVLLIFIINVSSTGIILNYCTLKVLYYSLLFLTALSSWWLAHWLSVGVAVFEFSPPFFFYLNDCL